MEWVAEALGGSWHPWVHLEWMTLALGGFLTPMGAQEWVAVALGVGPDTHGCLWGR